MGHDHFIRPFITKCTSNRIIKKIQADARPRKIRPNTDNRGNNGKQTSIALTTFLFTLNFLILNYRVESLRLFFIQIAHSQDRGGYFIRVPFLSDRSDGNLFLSCSDELINRRNKWMSFFVDNRLEIWTLVGLWRNIVFDKPDVKCFNEKIIRVHFCV